MNERRFSCPYCSKDLSFAETISELLLELQSKAQEEKNEFWAECYSEARKTSLKTDDKSINGLAHDIAKHRPIVSSDVMACNHCHRNIRASAHYDDDGRIVAGLVWFAVDAKPPKAPPREDRNSEAAPF